VKTLKKTKTSKFGVLKLTSVVAPSVVNEFLSQDCWHIQHRINKKQKAQLSNTVWEIMDWKMTFI